MQLSEVAQGLLLFGIQCGRYHDLDFDEEITTPAPLQPITQIRCMNFYQL